MNSMKKIFLGLIFLFPTLGFAETSTIATTTETILTYDITQENGKLRNYRNFAELHMSGSSQFSACELPYILQHAKGKVYIVDLRQEPHGFLNGKAFTWFSYRNQVNKNKAPRKVEQEAEQLLLELAAHKNITMHEIKKARNGRVASVKQFVVNIKKVELERELVKRSGANYTRIYALDRYKPRDAQVDAFVDFVRSLPSNAWLHFHCRAGKGRTTTFMVMYDMLLHAKQSSFKAIMARHLVLGGSAAVLNEFPTKEKSKWIKAAAKKRYKFLQDFYNYAVAKDGYGVNVWSAWINKVS